MIEGLKVIPTVPQLPLDQIRGHQCHGIVRIIAGSNFLDGPCPYYQALISARRIGSELSRQLLLNKKQSPSQSDHAKREQLVSDFRP